VDRFDPGSGDAKTKAFAEAYKAAYGDTPEFYAANYYEHVEFILRPLIKRIVDRNGDPAKQGEILAEMERALSAKVKFGSVYGGDMQIHPDGTVSKPLGVYEVKGESLTLVGRIVEGKIESK
jgi:branched-chain amino acid transport system substrate-binding protein